MTDATDNIKTRRWKKISDVIIKPQNIRELAILIHREYTKGVENDHRVSFACQMRTSDTYYESDNLEIFNENGLLETRHITWIDIDFYEFSENKRIHADITHSIYGIDNTNEVMVVGKPEIWVNGMIGSISTIIDGWQKQQNWLRKNRSLLYFIFTISTGSLYIIFLRTFDFIFTTLLKDIPAPAWLSNMNPTLADVLRGGAYIAHAFNFFYWGTTLGLKLLHILDESYPRVELATGPEHVQVANTRRSRVGAVVSLGLIPLIIAILLSS